MSKFEIGQKVVCVNDSSTLYDHRGKWAPSSRIIKGTVYVVRGHVPPATYDGLHPEFLHIALPAIFLVGRVKHSRIAGERRETGYAELRFAPLEPKQQSIEIFTKMLAPNKPELVG
jgi:hypothetical protein